VTLTYQEDAVLSNYLGPELPCSVRSYGTIISRFWQ
jgi:hypothetical protein